MKVLKYACERQINVLRWRQSRGLDRDETEETWPLMRNPYYSTSEKITGFIF
jgi:hypothetical protein